VGLIDNLYEHKFYPVLYFRPEGRKTFERCYVGLGPYGPILNAYYVLLRNKTYSNGVFVYPSESGLLIGLWETAPYFEASPLHMGVDSLAIGLSEKLANGVEEPDEGLQRQMFEYIEKNSKHK
jgi:hypothetical protein